MNLSYDRRRGTTATTTTTTTTDSTSRPTLFFDSSGDRSRGFYESAALLALWSYVVVSSGSAHLVELNPTLELYIARDLPTLVPFFSAIFEICLGLIGLFIAISALVVNVFNTPLTLFCLLLQMLLSLYVFAVSVFTVPIFRILALTAPLTPHLTIGQSRAVLSIAICSTFSFKLSVLLAQFLFMLRLVACATGELPVMMNGAAWRPIFWNLNMANVGVCTLVTSIILMHAEGSAKLLDVRYISSVQMNRLPLFAFFAGIFMVFWGVSGALIAYSRDITLKRYFVALSVAIYLIALLNFALLQPALIPSGPATSAALNSATTFTLVFLGPYFMAKRVEENGKFNISMDHSSSSRSESWVEDHGQFKIEMGKFQLEKL